MSTRIARRDRRNAEYGYGWRNEEAYAHKVVVTRARIAYELRTGTYWAGLGARFRKLGESFIPLAADMQGFADRLKDTLTNLAPDEEAAA